MHARPDYLTNQKTITNELKHPAFVLNLAIRDNRYSLIVMCLTIDRFSVDSMKTNHRWIILLIYCNYKI